MTGQIEFDPRSPTVLRPLERALATIVGEVTSIRQLVTNAKSTVVLVDGQRSSVVAKHAERRRLERELFVYERVLPELGLAGPSVRGWFDHEDGSWLMVDYVEGRAADLERPDDCRLAAILFAQLHARSQTAGLRLPQPLPIGLAPTDRIGLLEASLQEGEDRPSTREALLADCGRLRGYLPTILDNADALVAAFCHGDVAGQNLRVTTDSLVAVDWERSGITSPAIDIGRVDLAAYFDEYQRVSNAQLSRNDLVNAALAGRVLADLNHRLERKPIRTQQKYLGRMLRNAERQASCRTVR
jgi:hypothetical protein